jgi:hypothetical protein
MIFNRLHNKKTAIGDEVAMAHLSKHLISMTASCMSIVSCFCLLAGTLCMGVAHAAGDASFSVSPNSGSYNVGDTVVVNIAETSSAGDDTNAVQVNFSYDTSMLTYESMSLTGPFSSCGQQTGGSGSVSIGCSATSSQSGTQTIAQVSFTAVASGTAVVSMVPGSDIDSTSGTSVWDNVLPTATYTISPVTTTPAQTALSNTSSGSPAATNSTTATPTAALTTTTTPAASAPATITPAATGTMTETSTGTPIITTQPASGMLTFQVNNTQGQPISNAKVVVNGQYSSYTNAQGKVSIGNVSTGSDTVVVTAGGKSSLKEKIQLNTNQIKQVSVVLRPSSPLLAFVGFGTAAVVVLSGAGYAVFKFLQNRATRFSGYTGS